MIFPQPTAVRWIPPGDPGSNAAPAPAAAMRVRIVTSVAEQGPRPSARQVGRYLRAAALQPHKSRYWLKLIFYSCAPVFDVSPLLMGQESDRSDKHSATPHRIIPLKSRSETV